MVQAETFSSDLRILGNGQAVNSKSPLRLLKPFIDTSGLLRLGGRLRIEYDVRYKASDTFTGISSSYPFINHGTAQQNVTRWSC